MLVLPNYKIESIWHKSSKVGAHLCWQSDEFLIMIAQHRKSAKPVSCPTGNRFSKNHALRKTSYQGPLGIDMRALQPDTSPYTIPPPLTKRSQQKRALILSAAIRYFAEHGYE